MATVHRARLTASVLLGLTLGACLGHPDDVPLDDVGKGQSNLTAAQRRTRAGQIRDAAAANGITQGWLLAGIADAETGMSHCHSELTWACQGPASPDCGGGPVVAGAGDGPCADMQGGLGMFQFDAGTYAQTLAREGDRILLIAGNVQAGVDFVASMVVRSAYVPGVDNRDQAIEWINGVRIGNDRWDPWVRTVTHYYNGCAPSYSCFSSRYARYRDMTAAVHDEMGADFWSVADDWGAEYVHQTFPLARDPFELYPGQEVAGYLEMRNTGTASWTPGSTFLGTTEPRDGASLIAGSDWVSANRAATVDRVVAPGETGQFHFSVRGPAAVGDYPQFFNLVEEGVAWFSDQGGPVDGLLQVRVTVIAAPACAGGVGAAWSCEGDDRVRCVLGEIERETCAGGCLDEGAGAVCDLPSGPDGDGDGAVSSVDCDDADPSRYPGAWDFCEDGIDQDCDGRDRLCSELVDGSPPGGDAGARADAGVDGPVGPGRGGVEGCSASPQRGGGGGAWLLSLCVGVAIAAARRRRP